MQPPQPHNLNETSRLDHLGIPRLSQVLDEMFGILPPRYRKSNDPPYPSTIGDLHHLTKIGMGKLCEKLSWVAHTCQKMTAPPPFDILIGQQTTLGARQWSYDEWITHQQSILPGLPTASRIAIDTGTIERDFSLCLYLRQIGWVHTYLAHPLPKTSDSGDLSA